MSDFYERVTEARRLLLAIAEDMRAQEALFDARMSVHMACADLSAVQTELASLETTLR